MKKSKPVYGCSQGARLQNTNKESSTKIQYARSCEAIDRTKRKKIRIDKASIKSWPRTLVSICTFIVISQWLLQNTPVGQSIARNMTDRLSTTTNNIQEGVNLNNLAQQRQQQFDRRFDDKWKQACGKGKDC